MEAYPSRSKRKRSLFHTRVTPTRTFNKCAELTPLYHIGLKRPSTDVFYQQQGGRRGILRLDSKLLENIDVTVTKQLLVST